jgi:hypothetical protein
MRQKDGKIGTHCALFDFGDCLLSVTHRDSCIRG